jgi:hypothetical protein
MRAIRCKSFWSQWPWLAAVLLGVSGASLEAGKTGPGPMVGKVAPAFHIQGIFDESYSLETFKGHILVMQFGSSW